MEIATIPQINMYNTPSFSIVGVRKEIAVATPVPISNERTLT